MPEIDLDQTYMYKGDRFGPGLVNVPDELAIALGHSLTEESSNDEKKEEAQKAKVDRLAINSATAEEIADSLSGVGLGTAKKVIALRDSLPDQKFTAIDQLKEIPRVDWGALENAIDFEG